jgi:hypothetical protein
LIIGARTADGGGREKSGESYVVFGRAKGFPPVFELASLLAENGGDGTTGFVLNGIGAYDVSGTAVSAAGDVNGDGVGDLLIGTQRIGDITAAGEAYVVFGRRDGDGDGLADNVDNCQLHANADQRDTNGDGYGNVCDPDLNGDGIVNFIDLGQLKRVFLGSYPDADFDGNGIVNFTDLATMKTFFFGAPGPSGLAR